METSNKTARQLFEEIKARPTRARFGFGRKPALINIDLQKAYTLAGRVPDRLRDRPEADAVRQRARRASPVPRVYRSCGPMSPIWIVARIAAYGEPAPIRPTACRTSRLARAAPSSTTGSRSISKRDIIINKRMASAFHETNLASLLNFHRCDTVIVTGGSTSGCVRATVVDSLSRSYRTIVPEECVADKHESPHFANLYDMAIKYADVLPVSEVIAHLAVWQPQN